MKHVPLLSPRLDFKVGQEADISRMSDCRPQTSIAGWQFQPVWKGGREGLT